MGLDDGPFNNTNKFNNDQHYENIYTQKQQQQNFKAGGNIEIIENR